MHPRHLRRTYTAHWTQRLVHRRHPSCFADPCPWSLRWPVKRSLRWPVKNSLSNAGMLILSNPFLEFCISILAFSYIILLHLFLQAFDNWHIENSRALIWKQRYSEKGGCLSLSQALFLILCPFHMNLNKQNSRPHWLSTHCWQFI